MGYQVEWSVMSGDQVLGTKRGTVIAQAGKHLAIRVEQDAHDPSSPFVTRTVDSVQRVA